MRRTLYWLWLAAAVGLVVAAGWQTARTLRDGHFPPGAIYNADFLAPAALYQDLFVDGNSVRNFQFSACTFAFPDVVTYFGVRAVVGETTPAVPLWMVALVVLLFASGWVAAAALTPRPARAYLAPALLTLVAGYVAVNTYTFFGTPAADLLMPVYHCGAQLAGFLGLALVVGLMRAGTRWGRAAWLGGLALLSFVAAFSDRLYGPFFVAPVGLTLLLFLLRRRGGSDGPLPLTWGRSALAGVAMAVGSAAALGVLRALQGHTDPLDSYWGGGSAAGLGERLLSAVRMVAKAAADGSALVLVGLAWYAVCAAALGRWAVGRPPDRGFAFYAVFSVAQLGVMTGVFLVSKTGALSAQQELWSEVSRYFVGPLATALVGLALAAARAAAAGCAGVRLAGAGVPVGLAAVAVGVGLAQPRNEYYSLTDLRPPWVRAVDELCEAHDLRDGVTDYWTAKPIRLLSTRGTRPVPAYPAPGKPYGLQAFPWLGNPEWYWRPPAGGGEPRYRYVLATLDEFAEPHSLRVGSVVAELGEPRLRLGAWHLVLLVYDRPSDVRFHRFAELNCSVLNYRFRAAGPRGPYRYPGNSLQSLAPVTAAADERVAEEGKTPKGLMAFGPYLRPPTAGWHKVTYRLTCTGTTEANASVSVTCYDPATNTDRTLASRVLPAGFDDTVTLHFELTREMKRKELQFPVVFGGRGRVVLHWVEYE